MADPKGRQTEAQQARGHEYPRLLLVSNNSLSMTGSNGRTLANLLEGYPADQLAQFFVTAQVPDSTRAGNYFRITDREAASYALRRRSPGQYVTPTGTRHAAQAPPRSRRTPLRLLLRELIWLHLIYREPRGLRVFLEDFDPELILLQAGDSGFMFRMVRRIAKTRSIPYMIYNSEDYFFKDHNYLAGSRLQWPWYKLWRLYYSFTLRQVFADAGHVFFSCQPLRERFEAAIPIKGSVLLTPTTIEARRDAPSPTLKRIVYAGNLGVGRLQAILDFAGIAAAVAPASEISIFGPQPTPDDLQRLRAAPNIQYRGFVSYTEVIDQLRSADLLLHVESFEPRFRRDVAYAFSTKIPDCLASGTCLLLFAPPELAITQYLKAEAAALVAESHTQVRELLIQALTNPGLARDTSHRARHLAKSNHTVEGNSMRLATEARRMWTEGIVP